jgi:DNA-binding transcriptional LysR family regulator
MDLRQLEYVVAVAEEGGFRPAARRLHTSQPPLSMAIRQLEIELGVKIFERSTRGVILTQSGTEFVHRARDILAQIDGARDAVRGRDDRRKTALRIAVLNGKYSAGELTSPILDALHDRFEGAEIILHETTFIDQVEALRSGEVDLAFIRPPVPLAELAVIPIAQEPRCLVVGSRHPLAEADVLSADEVLNLPMLGLSAPPDWARVWQLDDLRGGALLDQSMGPVRTVAGAQLALTMGRAAITMSQSTTRLAPAPAVHSLAVEGLSPSIFAVAHRRSDTRRLTRDAVAVIATTAAANIHLLPDGELLV